MDPAMKRKLVLFLLAFMVACLWLVVPVLCGQRLTQTSRVAGGIFAGIARPSDEAFRQIYGPRQFPVSTQTNVGVYKGLNAFCGYAFVSRDGHVITVGPRTINENEPLKFKVHTVKAGGLYAHEIGKWTLLAGGGIGFSHYREKWEAAGIDTSDSRKGLLLQTSIEYPNRSRLALAGRMEYYRLPIRAKSASEVNTDLGRLDLALGVVFRLK